ncbi:T0036871 isoform 5, partial [Pan troglodytes]
LIHGMLSGVHLYWQRSFMTMMLCLLSWKTPT